MQEQQKSITSVTHRTSDVRFDAPDQSGFVAGPVTAHISAQHCLFDF